MVPSICHIWYYTTLRLVNSERNGNFSVTVNRVLARISKMPDQNSNSESSAHPNLATNLFQITLPSTYISLLCQKGNSHFSYVLEDGLLGKYLVITPKKSKLKILHRRFCLSKKEVFRKLPLQKTGWTVPGLAPDCE